MTHTYQLFPELLASTRHASSAGQLRPCSPGKSSLRTLCIHLCPAGVGATQVITRLGTLTQRQTRVMRSNARNGFKLRSVNIATMSGFCFLPNRQLYSLHLTSLMPLGWRFSLGRGVEKKSIRCRHPPILIR